jgi:DNA helicase-2/ATP-dependent DNA helicase PcrA
MAMFADDGGYDVVASVEKVELRRYVYDLNVDGVHNFIANGLITHNSIYSFRSADIRNILDFEKDYPDAEVIKLEQNYRSTGTILDAANAVIANNREQKPKQLWTEIGRGEPITIAELDDEHAEARYVAAEVERLCTDEGIARDEVAVFYRVNAQSRVLEDTLVRFELPYQVIGGTKFYDRAEIKDAVAYLQLLANPADAVSFQRIVNSPRRGIGDSTQARLLSHANTTGADVWDVIREVERVPGLGTAPQRAVRRFADTMVALSDRVEGRPVAELLEAVLRETGYLEALEAERTIEAEGRVENLQELVGVAGEFDTNRAMEGESDTTPLEEFLAQISLLSEQDALREGESLITLMTLHNAKGLEYEAVFLIGCEEGVFPHSRSIEEGNLEEERRLCYVGLTRARQRLYLTCARRRNLFGGSGHNLPSRFLGELPDELVERHVSAPRTGWQTAGAGDGRAAVLGGSFGSGRGGLPTADDLRKQPHPELVQFRTGDDVVHASFGEGVVTAVEPGSVVIVRFAADGSERKLMADYAPLRKAS